jgi:hypothetical protein
MPKILIQENIMIAKFKERQRPGGFHTKVICRPRGWKSTVHWEECGRWGKQWSEDFMTTVRKVQKDGESRCVDGVIFVW